MTNDLRGLPLFDEPIAPHRRNSPTSLAAAVEITPKVGRIQLAVLSALADEGPMVIDNIAVKTKRVIGTVRPRVTELKDAGFVAVTQRQGRSAFGKRQAVVAITHRGLEYLRRSA